MGNRRFDGSKWQTRTTLALALAFALALALTLTLALALALALAWAWVGQDMTKHIATDGSAPCKASRQWLHLPNHYADRQTTPSKAIKRLLQCKPQPQPQPQPQPLTIPDPSKHDGNGQNVLLRRLYSGLRTGSRASVEPKLFGLLLWLGRPSGINIMLFVQIQDKETTNTQTHTDIHTSE